MSKAITCPVSMKSFHHSPLTSPRIQKVLQFLQGRGLKGATTIELTDYCNTTRASSDVSELKACGVMVDCNFERTTDDGRKVYRYTLA